MEHGTVVGDYFCIGRRSAVENARTGKLTRHTKKCYIPGVGKIEPGKFGIKFRINGFTNLSGGQLPITLKSC